eukprot:jgi/Bigna1/85406/estExt_fgenesh1_pg.C_40011
MDEQEEGVEKTPSVPSSESSDDGAFDNDKEDDETRRSVKRQEESPAAVVRDAEDDKSPCPTKEQGEENGVKRGEWRKSVLFIAMRNLIMISLRRRREEEEEKHNSSSSTLPKPKKTTLRKRAVELWRGTLLPPGKPGDFDGKMPFSLKVNCFLFNFVKDKPFCLPYLPGELQFEPELKTAINAADYIQRKHALIRISENNKWYIMCPNWRKKKRSTGISSVKNPRMANILKKAFRKDMPPNRMMAFAVMRASSSSSSSSLKKKKKNKKKTTKKTINAEITSAGAAADKRILQRPGEGRI